MPALRNERLERFAQGIAKGKNGADAYLAAGYALARGAAARNAYRLRRREDVRVRIDELAAQKYGRVAVEQVVESVRTGRPTLYRPELCEMARRLALLGLNEAEMADAFNVDVHTISDWRANHREFRQAIERGGVHADAKVAERTYYRALGYRAPATKIMQYGGQPIIVPYVEHYPPDTTAASLWLRNRQPNKWRDKHEVDVTGTLEHRLSQMTPEERARDALELAERVKRRILEYRQTIEREPAAEPTEPEE